MKLEFNAEIVGHEVFRPDPDDRKHKAIRLKLQVASMTPALGKPTRGVLPIAFEDCADFPLGGFLRITVVETQQEMEFAPPAKKGHEQLGLVPTEGKKPRRSREAEAEPLH
jgi:hypothetical protein